MSILSVYTFVSSRPGYMTTPDKESYDVAAEDTHTRRIDDLYFRDLMCRIPSVNADIPPEIVSHNQRSRNDIMFKETELYCFLDRVVRCV